MGQSKRENYAILILFLIFTLIYVSNITGWVMHDDEGTDFYEVWRFQQGEVPGEDFIAEQQPLYLYAGRALLNLAGHTILPLRLLSAFHILGGTFILALAIRRIWGARIAIMAAGLVLVSGQVYEIARLFRPDPLMLGWELAGLGMVLLAVHTKRRHWWLWAGFCYGVSILWKPFGVIPVVGLVIYFLVRLWREQKRGRVIMDGLYFSAPFLLAAIGFSMLLYARTGFYYLEPFQYHQGMGQENKLWQQIGMTISVYILFFVENMFWLLIFPLAWLNKAKGWLKSDEMRVLWLLLLSPVIFFLVSRPVYTRYFVYLTPVFALFIAYHLDLAFKKMVAERPSFNRVVPFIIMAILLYAMLIPQIGFRPSVLTMLTRSESGTKELAQYVAEHTEPDDIVISDYAGINFFAKRASIYEASIVAQGQIEGGFVTGELLIDRIEEEDVAMVLIHVEGGEPIPHHLINLIDSKTFQAYLAEHFALLTTFDRTGQQIEIYQKQ